MDRITPGDVDAFKQAFRRLSAGVSAVTALDPDGSPVGFTATSLASLSAAPPLATFNMARKASAYRAVHEGTHVLVHILGARNRDVAIQLAGDRDQRFVGDHWEPGPGGLPLLKNVPAWMYGRIVERVAVVESALVVVEIEDGGLGEPDEALIYHERDWYSTGDPLA
ncbi:MAG: flavin reductase family protein [Actinomycetales bacterium]|nr:flavin reductase family protein [Actinomycetales bacterium]